MATPPDVHGPIDFLLLEFDADKADGSAAVALRDLVESGTIRLYDLLVITKEDDGSVSALELSSDEPRAWGGFGDFAGARSGLVDDEDVAEAGSALEPGKAAALIVYENAWAVPFVTAARSIGAEVVASARIPADVVMAALDALDSQS